MRSLRTVAGFVIGASITLFAALPTEAAPTACVPADQCCKICDKGQACGNTCIARTKSCHKGRGCACNASEVCAE
jgi:hypothetical protein